MAHLTGKIKLGTYALDPSSQARFIVFDADDGLNLNERFIYRVTWQWTVYHPIWRKAAGAGTSGYSSPSPTSGKDARLFVR